MKLTFEPLGKYVRLVDERNTEMLTDSVLGINIDKFFMPSVANVIGTDLRNYKMLRNGRFACNPMHVGRDGRLPVALYKDDSPSIVSPAYFLFEIIDNNEIEPDYLMLCFRHPDFDRMCWFRTDASVRGGIAWEDVCNLVIPVPSITEQRKIVHEYQVITDRIELLGKMNVVLEKICSTTFETINESALQRGSITLGDIMSFSNGKPRPEINGNIPVYGGNGIMSYTDKSNAERVVIIGRVGAYCGSVYLENNPCWISDNAIVAKSSVTEDEYFDYCLLKNLNLYNHHVGTGQQLLTQGILSSISCPAYSIDDILCFNQLINPIFKSIIVFSKEKEYLKKLLNLLLSSLTTCNCNQENEGA